MGITWEEAEVAAQNRSEWRRSVAQCIQVESRPGWRVKYGRYRPSFSSKSGFLTRARSKKVSAATVPMTDKQ